MKKFVPFLLLLSRICLTALPLLLVSCMTHPVVTSVRAPRSTYKAHSPCPRNELPPVVYLFPPLKCDLNGNPIEKMSMSGSLARQTAEWSSPSAVSRSVRQELTRKLRGEGYQVVSFPEVLKTEQPYSIMVVSTFYSDRVKQKPAVDTPPSEYLMTRLIAKSFDHSLNPVTSRALSQVDSVTYFDSAHREKPLEFESIAQLFDYAGENVEGTRVF